VNYLITGGTGLIGCALIKKLSESVCHITVLTRDKSRARLRLNSSVRVVENLNDITPDQSFDYVINLAGEPIADKRWGQSQKKKLWQSRVALTQQLVAWMNSLEQPVKAMVSGSAVGWYGDGGDLTLDERSKPHPEYTHELCDAWEGAAREATVRGTRVCIIRTGLVLSPVGGFLSKMKLPFKLGLGTVLGSGNQAMSWVHIDDVVCALRFLIGNGDSDTSLRCGVFNLASPCPVTNREFSVALAKQFNRRVYLSVPTLFLSAGLGEMARLLTTGQRIVPKHVTELGFEFHYTSLENALEQVLN